jgi:hypothetical protein
VGYGSYQNCEAAEGILGKRLECILESRIRRTQTSPRCYPGWDERSMREGAKRERVRTDLSANANLAGRIGMSGAVKNATKKQTAAPNKHAPKPINLER